MIHKLIGCLSIIVGLFWLLKPQLLRDWFRLKTGRYLFWMAMAVFFFPLMHFGKVIGLSGIILLLVLLFVGRNLMLKTLRTAFERIPLPAFQTVGFLSILSGALLLWRN